MGRSLRLLLSITRMLIPSCVVNNSVSELYPSKRSENGLWDILHGVDGHGVDLNKYENRFLQIAIDRPQAVKLGRNVGTMRNCSVENSTPRKWECARWMLCTATMVFGKPFSGTLKWETSCCICIYCKILTRYQHILWHMAHHGSSLTERPMSYFSAGILKLM